MNLAGTAKSVSEARSRSDGASHTRSRRTSGTGAWGDGRSSRPGGGTGGLLVGASLEGAPQQGLSATNTTWALQGLAQFYKASGYEPAGRLARKLAIFLQDHADIYDAKGRYLYSQQELDGLKAWKHELQTNPERLGGHHHHHSIGVLAIADYAAAVGDKELLRWAAASYEWARDHDLASKTVGFFAEYLQRDYPSAETCEIADMLGLAVKLSAAGAGDYWDDVDRYVRNQFVENQLSRHDWLERLPAATRLADTPPTPGEKRPGSKKGTQLIDSEMSCVPFSFLFLCSVRCKSRNPIPNCCHRGRCPGFLAGRLASTSVSRNRNCTRFGRLLSEASHWATKPGLNPLQDGSTLNPPCVLKADHKFVFRRTRQTKDGLMVSKDEANK